MAENPIELAVFHSPLGQPNATTLMFGNAFLEEKKTKPFGMAERIWFESLTHEIHIKFIEEIWDIWGIQL